MVAGTVGHVIQIKGAVVDVVFPIGKMPDIYNALEINHEGRRVILEVEQQLPQGWVRCVAMDTTDGLQRGMAVTDTGAPITVPIGPHTLGRIFNVLGEPIDGYAAMTADTPMAPIHKQAPTFEEQSPRREMFITGIKVIDLIAPFTKGGKTGVFGGAGVG